MINYNDKLFKPVNTTENSETSNETIFKYKQRENILTAEYEGGKIVYGHLLGLVDHEGNIEMRYHQINQEGELMTGTCSSKPELLANGKIRLHETWQWTSGDQSKGQSIIDEQ
ncbi:n-acetylglutamate synthase [Pedobacter sp. BG31]|uniref:n-acetylglutamate synthase n=1 Tax=Pedobacter sp. BG31 TaxID=3349697 RepID=UPI0035F2E38A